jgi:hypothetical protein
VHIHGFVGASSTIAASNLVVNVVPSNFAIVALDSTKVQMQRLATIQVQAIAWKPHS